MSNRKTMKKLSKLLKLSKIPSFLNIALKPIRMIELRQKIQVTHPLNQKKLNYKKEA